MRRLIVLLVALVAAVAAYVLVMRDAPVTLRAATRKAASSEGKQTPAAAHPDPAGYDVVPVSISIPPLSRFPAAWASGHGCVHTQLTRILGAAVSQGNGVVVFATERGGAADRAGIKPGDRLGDPNACPQTVIGSFFPGKQARTVSWQVYRPRTAAIREAAAREAAAHPFVTPPLLNEEGGSAATTPSRREAGSRSPASPSPTRTRSADPRQ